MVDDVGVGREQSQAQDGRFESELARNVWLVVSSFEPVTS